MKLLDRARKLLHDRRGPLTQELVRRPGGFGLGQVPAQSAPDAMTSMVCGYCSVGCSLDVHLKDGTAVNLTPSAGYPVNLGMACPKGWEALTPLQAPDRATTPLLRDEAGRLAPVDWTTAVETFVARMKAVQARHGPASVAFLGTGQLPSEELALLGTLAKLGMGMVHGDGNTRQCMATAVSAYKATFGFDAPPFTYQDLESSDVLVFVGSNPCIAHPILWERVCRNPHRPAIVVLDPRRTETAMAATSHLALRPKSDLVLLYGLARLLIAHGWIDRAFIEAHTSGFEAFALHVAEYPPERVEAATGLPFAAIEKLAQQIHAGERVSFWWTMGVNQSHEGVRVAEAIIALALLTGNIGRPGTGANSITGQCNAMGSRLFSNTTNLLGGHAFGDPEGREKVAAALGVDPGVIPAEDSLAYDQILEGVLAGKIRALWIVGTNPSCSWINQADLPEIFGRLEFLVVQDMYASTATAQAAHLVLPAAGWGEKEGTFINSERRIGLLKRVARAPGQALADFYIFKLIADAWGSADLVHRWTSPEAAFAILREVTRGQPCDITGIDGYAMIEAKRGVQWPLPEGETVEEGSERRLFADGRFFHPDGRARFVFGEPRRLPEATSAEYPFTLLTGRGSSSQWHTDTRTRTSAVLRKLGPGAPYVELSPVDAAGLGIAPNQRVVVESRRGRYVARAFLTHAVQPGQVFVPMHYARANRLTLAAFDPESRQPAYKACAVRVRPFEDTDRGDLTDDSIRPPRRPVPQDGRRHRLSHGLRALRREVQLVVKGLRAGREHAHQVHVLHAGRGGDRGRARVDAAHQRVHHPRRIVGVDRLAIGAAAAEHPHLRLRLGRVGRSEPGLSHQDHPLGVGPGHVEQGAQVALEVSEHGRRVGHLVDRVEPLGAHPAHPVHPGGVVALDEDGPEHPASRGREQAPERGVARAEAPGDLGVLPEELVHGERRVGDDLRRAALHPGRRDRRRRP